MPDLITTAVSGATFNVYYEVENRQKRIEWVSGTATVNDLYSALQDKFDDLGQMDDGVPMSAQTPTEYTIGIIDTGDDDPWFIDDTTVEYLTGGAIQTANWTRVTTTNTGIVKIEVTANTGGGGIDLADIGTDVTTGSTDQGVLLGFTDKGSDTATLWIRPDSDLATMDFDAGANGTITVGSHSASYTYDVSEGSETWATGESLWANIFTIGTISSNTHIYVEQNDALLTASAAATDWWGDGHLNGTEGITVKVKSMDVEIDEGVITVFARQLTKTYSHFETDLTNGGRTAIPLGTGTDLNASEGVRQMVLTTGATAEPLVGDVISDDAAPTVIQGVITSVSGTNPNVTLQYYLIGDPLTDFSTGANAFTAAPSGFTSTNVASQTDVNAGALAGVTFAFTADVDEDIDEDDTTEEYSIVINASDETLADVYQYTQYLTRRGETATLDDTEGQFYRGIDTMLEYSGSVSGGTIDEGNTVTQETSGATGTIVAHDTANNIITLRDSRGTFATHAADETLTDDTTSATVEIDTTAEAVSPNAASPFGTFAGGIWFFARGVTVDPAGGSLLSTDAQNFRALTNDGTVITPPNKVTVEVTNLRDEDRVTVHRLDTGGGVVKKDTYAGTVQSAGATILVAGSTITSDEPGKTTGGTVVLVGDDEKAEYPLRYDSWSSATFTLSNVNLTTLTADGSNCTATQLTDTGANFVTNGVQVGDLLRNTTESAIAYVTVVVGENELTTTAVGDWTSDVYDINTLPIATTAADTVYVPLLYKFDGTGTDGATTSQSTTLTYSSDIPALVRVRNATSTASTTTPMIPYAAEVTVTSTGLSNAAIRTLDSIHS